MVFKSKVLNIVFDQIYNEFGDPRLFGRFRNFLISHGLKYGYYLREYSIITMRNDYFTTFGEIVSKIIEKQMNDFLKNDDKLFGSFDFEKEINCSESELIKKIIEKINDCRVLFLEKENDTKCHKKQFGNSVNNLLESLGATNFEKQCYWKHINDKNLITPEIYLGYLKYIDNKNIDKNELISILSINDINKLTKVQRSFLPDNISVAHQLIKSHIDSRG